MIRINKITKINVKRTISLFLHELNKLKNNSYILLWNYHEELIVKFWQNMEW